MHLVKKYKKKKHLMMHVFGTMFGILEFFIRNINNMIILIVVH